MKHGMMPIGRRVHNSGVSSIRTMSTILNSQQLSIELANCQHYAFTFEIQFLDQSVKFFKVYSPAAGCPRSCFTRVTKWESLYKSSNYLHLKLCWYNCKSRAECFPSPFIHFSQLHPCFCSSFTNTVVPWLPWANCRNNKLQSKNTVQYWYPNTYSVVLSE